VLQSTVPCLAVVLVLIDDSLLIAIYWLTLILLIGQQNQLACKRSCSNISQTFTFEGPDLMRNNSGESGPLKKKSKVLLVD